jgi:hypothetical protein
MNETFINISKIIERDSKATTYKFALLRGVIDIIQDNSPYISIEDEKVTIPTGLLVEKWLLYYYPILESPTFIPQINGKSKLAFEILFLKFIQQYKTRGGFSAFYNDLKSKGIPEDVQADFFRLTKSIRDTITKMPMKYIGRSLSDSYYSIFNYKNSSFINRTSMDLERLIHDFGTFTMPLEYYEAFKILGSFISGQNSILFKWASFSVTASKDSVSIENVLTEVLKSPIEKRDSEDSKKL